MSDKEKCPECRCDMDREYYIDDDGRKVTRLISKKPTTRQFYADKVFYLLWMAILTFCVTVGFKHCSNKNITRCLSYNKTFVECKSLGELF